MKQYIDKAALVAEIERRKKEAESNCGGYKSYEEHRCDSCIVGFYEEFLEILDTLEVKEMQEDSASEDLEEAIGQSFIYHENHGDDFRSDKQIESAYRYGFESGAGWQKKQDQKQQKEVDWEKEIKDYLDNQPIVTRSKGIDYKLVPSPEAIAKHFFELGLKAQKGK